MPISTVRGGKRLARPHRIRISLRDDAGGATPLKLPERRMWPMGLVIGVFFAIFAALWWVQVGRIRFNATQDLFDLMFNLFNLFWVMGWSVAVLILGLLTVLLLLYGEAARISGDRLVTVSILGPVRIFSEYLLGDIRNLRTENSGGAEMARVRFDYAQGSRGLGDAMPREEAAQLIAAIRTAMPRDRVEPIPEAASGNELASPETVTMPEAGKPAAPAPPARWYSPSTLALIAANLVPLAGVLFLGWGLGNVVVLFWAESAVIGFYTLLKMAVVGRFAVLLAGPFFAGHFGGFMAAHFLFIDGLFLSAGLKPSEQPRALDVIAALLAQLWPALLALFVSHGISFAWHFILQREHRRLTVSALMIAPYRRIMVMHLAILFGGFGAMMLNAPALVLVLLIGLKIFADLHAHLREHAPGRISKGNDA